MSTTGNSTSLRNGHSISLDTWAVIIALLLAVAVRFGVFKSVPW